MASNFFQMPQTAGRRDIQIGVSELGQPVMQTPQGDVYVEYPNALDEPPVGGYTETRDIPGYSHGLPVPRRPSLRDVGRAIWGGVEAPGNALAGEPTTYGDVAATALDFGLINAPVPLPRNALGAARVTRPLGADDFRGMHTAPSRLGYSDGSIARLDDLATVMPDDIYDKRVALRYYGHGGMHRKADNESIKAIWDARGNPDGTVKIYRAVPANAGDDILPGDWVSLSPTYARQHGEMLGDFKIIEEEVPVRHIFHDANSINEFGYDPGVTAVTTGNPDRGFTLNRLEVPEGERGTGLGTRAMDEITADADALGAQVGLTPSGDFGGNVPRLREFYERFGFVVNRGRNRDFRISEDMYRDPRNLGPR